MEILILYTFKSVEHSLLINKLTTEASNIQLILLTPPLPQRLKQSYLTLRI